MTVADIDRGVLAGTGYDRSTQYDTLNELAAALAKQQETKVDYVVDTRRMSFTYANDRFDQPSEHMLMFDQEGGEVDGGALTEHAHNQIAQRLAIPKKYYDRMRSDAPTLLTSNVEHWFHVEPERRMIRMLEGKVRAFVSDRYRRLDNWDLMERSIIPVLSETPGLHFQVASLTPDLMHINALLPGLSAEIAVGDVVQAGVAIRNSEVGKGSLSVAPRVWRLSCLNGLLVDALALRTYHVGRKADEEAYELFADDTLAADDAAYFLKCRDMVRSSLTEASFLTIVEKLRETADPVNRVSDPVATTERLADKHGLSDEEGKSVLRHLIEGGDLTQWGLVNAVTAAAKDADTFDRQRDMEALGGVVGFDMSRTEWAALAAA